MRHRRTILAVTLLVLASGAQGTGADEPQGDYRTVVERRFRPPSAGHWFQARAAAIPRGAPGVDGAHPAVVLTMQPHGSTGTHAYLGIASARSDDLGASWRGPTTHPELDVHPLSASTYEVPVDATPVWHAATGKLLLVGATFHVDKRQNHDIAGAASDVFYAVYDPQSETWNAWKKLAPPDDFEWPYKRAGCVQPVVRADGQVLLPIYFGDHNNSIHLTTVVRCEFDGETLRWKESGDNLAINFGRGYSEPSLAEFDGRYYLTLRNDRAGYVAASDDGLQFDEPQLWRFDDGAPLGSCNTQQHWMTHSDGLFLVYTRSGVDNDDVFRHRAPLMMARVDPTTLRVIRSSERIVVPKIGAAAMGNFGVCHVTPEESWIVVAFRPTDAANDENVCIARVMWQRPNLLASPPATRAPASD